MPLGMEIGVFSGDFVFDGDPATPRKKEHPTQFLAHVYCGQTAGSWMDEDASWYGSRPRPGHIVLDGIPALCDRGTAALPIFSAHVYCGHGRQS